jgi:hypothetical protein
MPLAPDVGQKIKSEGSGPSQKTKPSPFRSEGNLHVTHYLSNTDYPDLSTRTLTATGDLGLGLGIWDLGLLRGYRKATSVTAMSDVT